jgi:Ca-activated chloride channel family protein
MPGAVRSSGVARVRTALVLVSIFGLAVAAAGPGQAGRNPTSRPTDRAMFVSVLDKDGAPVAGLTAGDFVVREDRVAREVIRAEKATEPITLALLVDNSQSATPYVADMRLALKPFVKRLGGRNPITITVFGERPSILTDYTLDMAALEKGVDRLFPISGSGSYLLQAVEDISKGLAKRDYERAVILVVTAGGPEFTERHSDDVIPKVLGTGATFDAMVIAPRPPDLSDYGQRNREIFLDAAARATGGDRVTLLSSLALAGALDRLANELMNQYRITYGRPDTLIPPEKIEVGVRRPGLTARGTPVKPRKG